MTTVSDDLFLAFAKKRRSLTKAELRELRELQEEDDRTLYELARSAGFLDSEEVEELEEEAAARRPKGKTGRRKKPRVVMESDQDEDEDSEDEDSEDEDSEDEDYDEEDYGRRRRATRRRQRRDYDEDDEDDEDEDEDDRRRRRARKAAPAPSTSRLPGASAGAGGKVVVVKKSGDAPMFAMAGGVILIAGVLIFVAYKASSDPDWLRGAVSDATGGANEMVIGGDDDDVEDLLADLDLDPEPELSEDPLPDDLTEGEKKYYLDAREAVRLARRRVRGGDYVEAFKILNRFIEKAQLSSNGERALEEVIDPAYEKWTNEAADKAGPAVDLDAAKTEGEARAEVEEVMPGARPDLRPPEDEDRAGPDQD